jgi:hypothetical protein
VKNDGNADIHNFRNFSPELYSLGTNQHYIGSNLPIQACAAVVDIAMHRPLLG